MGGKTGLEARASGLGATSPQIDRFIPVTKLKYYFAVDTMYVGKKLGLLFFPYLHQVSTPPAEVNTASGGAKSRGGGGGVGAEGESEARGMGGRAGLPQERAWMQCGRSPPPGGPARSPHSPPQDWEVQYQQDTPVAPRFDVNAPDLYIPGSPPRQHPAPSSLWAGASRAEA